jgi:hypothetical protein
VRIPSEKSGIIFSITNTTTNGGNLRQFTAPGRGFSVVVVPALESMTGGSYQLHIECILGWRHEVESVCGSV